MICLFVFLLLWLIFIFFTWKRVSNKFFYLLLFVFCVLIGGNTNNPDTGIYYDMYVMDSLFTKDILFGYLILFSKTIGLNFDEFRLIICSFSLLLLYCTVFKYSKSIFVFTILFILSEFFYAQVQLRNFMAISLVIYSIPYLLSKRIFLVFYSVIILLVSCFIQKTMFAILIIVPFSLLINYNKKLIFIILTISVMIAFMCLNNSVMDVLEEVIKNLHFSGIDDFSERTTNYGWLIYFLIHFLSIYITYTIYNKDQNNILYKFTFMLNVLSSIYLPLYILDINYTRILRDISLLNCIIISRYYSLNKESIYNILSYKISKYNIIVCIAFVLMFSSYYILNGYTETIVLNTFTHNWILTGYPSTGKWF